MKIARLTACMCLLLLCGCMAPAKSQDLRSALDAQLQENAKDHGIPAQAVLVMHNGKTLYSNQTGWVDVDAKRAVGPGDVYAVYSVSKLFVSTLIYQLADQGRLDLEAPASRYVPDLPVAWRDLHVDQLLNHSSGLPDYYDAANPGAAFPRTREDAFRALADKPFQFTPGTETRYTQTNYLILQALLERLHGAPYREIVRERITKPLGLKDTYLGLGQAPNDRLVTPYRGEDGRLVRDQMIPWPDYGTAHAELFATPRDLGSFLTAVARGKFAQPDTLVRLWHPYRLRNGETGPFASGWDYGESDGYREVGHDGGVKVRVRILFRNDDLNDHYVIVYLTNGTRDNVWTRTLVESVQRIILRKSQAGGASGTQ